MCINPSMIILDIEGSDGLERGWDNKFEKQSALFAMTISDVVIVNMHIGDVGRRHAGSISLFETIFQERTKLPRSKTTLLVIIRDYDNEPPADILEEQVITAIVETWNSIHRNALFDDYFMLLVRFLPFFKKEETFKKQVADLRGWFEQCNLAGSRQTNVSASDFAHSSEKLWDDIQHNKQLCIPDHRVMISEYICGKSVNRRLKSLDSNQEYSALERNSMRSPLDFKIGLADLMSRNFEQYDLETDLYDENVRTAKKEVLKSVIIKHAEPFYRNLLSRLHDEIVDASKKKIAHVLRKDPNKSVNYLVVSYLDKFDRSYRGQDIEKYIALESEMRQKLKIAINTFAREMSRIIKEAIERRNRRIAIGIDVAGRILVLGATVACVAAGVDPSACFGGPL